MEYLIPTDMNEKREAYIRVAIAMAKSGVEDLLATADKSQYFLRGIIDWDEDGKKANLKHNRAHLAYRFSTKAAPLKFHKPAYEERNRKEKDEEKERERLESKLHAEHIIPNSIVFNEFVEMVRRGCSDDELGNFLRENCEIVIITKLEQKTLDGKSHCNLKNKMPEGWNWGDSRYARLDAAGIEIEPEDSQEISELKNRLKAIDYGQIPGKNHQKAEIITKRITDEVVQWSKDCGWEPNKEVSIGWQRPYGRGWRQGRVDVIIDRQNDDLPKLAIEIDRTDYWWSLSKLQFCSREKGWESLWIRWGKPINEKAADNVSFFHFPIEGRY